MTIRLSPRFISILLLAALAAFGITLVLRATPEGLGLSDDSIGYIAGARSMLAGQGYREAWLASNGPVTHFPPAFSSVLAFVGLFGLDPLRGARFLNASLFGLNIALMGILGWRMTKSLAAGLGLAALFLLSNQLLRVHAVAMSEPLFIFLSLLAFWMFDLFVERDEHWLWLLACGIATGMAYLTRYAGLALLATFLVALLFLHKTWRRQLTSVGILLLGAAPWAIGWALRNEAVGGSATNRILIWHPITAANFETALYNVSTFLMPVEVWRRELFKTPAIFVVLMLVALGAALAWTLTLVRRLLRRPPETADAKPLRTGIAFTNGLYVFGYLAAIFASMSYFDASTKFKVRILAPIYVSLLILFVLFAQWLWGRRREAVIALAVIIFALFAYGEASALSELRKGGQGYASFQWYDSKTMAFLRALPPSVQIYTNEPGAVYLYVRRGAYVLPDRVDPVTAEPRPGFDRGVAEMQAEIKAGRAALALFGGDNISTADAQALSNGLYLAHKSAGDEVYTAEP
ncbi:MAG TPA: phospholipid carrier-dependent glycosyltransferase [Anaerolineales bacterium]|nr:phospholipid carrier-dependent glycosyltransferase [Anaerolineales bacterium]